jgi:ribosomal protein S27AE
MDEDDVIAMQVSCSRCGKVVKNDLPRSEMPSQIEFLDRLRVAGWDVMHHQSGTTGREGGSSERRLCPKCASVS